MLKAQNLKAQNRQSGKRHKAPSAFPRPQPNGQTNAAQQRPPIVFWGGLWAIVFLIGITALANLLNPASSKDPQLAKAQMPTPVTSAPIAAAPLTATTAQPTEQSGQFPIWLFGAIVLSCSAGSLLLSRQLTPAPAASSRHRLKQRVANKSGRAGRQRAPVSNPGLRSPSTPVPPFRPAEGASLRSRPPQAGSPTRLMPVVPVTVVPFEQPHPLDQNEANLADLLDLRNQSPEQWGYRRGRS